MRIIRDNDIDRSAWHALLRSSHTATWFQSPEAYDFYASLPSIFTPFALALINHKFEIINHKSPLRGVCLVYITCDPNPIMQFFSRRAIIIGGPCLSDDATPDEVAYLMSNVVASLTSHSPLRETEGSSNPIYIETRNFNSYAPWIDAFTQAGFTYHPHLNFHVPISFNHSPLGEKEGASLSENRRRQLSKSFAAGVRIILASSELEIRSWYEILAHLYRTKVKTPLFPLDFFLTAFRTGVGHFLLVKYRDTIIGGNMVVVDDHCVYEWFECGLDTDYRELYPSVVATYAGIDFARQSSLPRYDMMGAGEPDVPYGVRDFKARFGGTLVEHGRFIHIAHPFLYRLGAKYISFIKHQH